MARTTLTHRRIWNSQVTGFRVPLSCNPDVVRSKVTWLDMERLWAARYDNGPKRYLLDSASCGDLALLSSHLVVTALVIDPPSLGGQVEVVE